ncbi:MAG: Wzt carbohydrate-binding domain-containing protein [Acidobacteriota bacterium]|nr:Wzt carbohydrate-binding domain-containing protein [Acidobacteriota bacterium]
MIEFQRPAVTAPDGCIVGVLLESGDLPGDADGILRFPFREDNAVARARRISKLLEARRAGRTFVLISHDEPLLEKCADEIWWIRDGELIARGDPAEILPEYRRYTAEQLRAAGHGIAAMLAPVIRNGDGRAALESIELTGENGQSSVVFRSGEQMSIRVTVKYAGAVEDPVIGILIRTRIGLNVYGTNTELEQLHPGPVAAGDTLRITYSFQCDLCPGDYTVTAASHDPDGVWHDWQEDAVAFAVSDSRYTAGVANLRARVYAEHQRQSASV